MFQITLRTVRESFGYSVEEVAEHCGIPSCTLIAYEIDTSTIPFTKARRLSEFFNVSFEDIYIGHEKECFELNRKQITHILHT